MNNKEMRPLLIMNLIAMTIIILAIAFGAMRDDDNTYDQYFSNSVSLEVGKSIGRNAMLQYLNETGQLKDSVTIDIYELMDMEDKMDSSLNKKK